LLSRQNGRANPGGRLAAIVAMIIIAIYALRAGPAVATRRRDLVRPFQPGAVGADPDAGIPVDGVEFRFSADGDRRLRNEVADLALLDDLTGVGNRGISCQRLTEECAKSARSDEPFALLVVDLDGFKAINDSHGHAAGDACLQHSP